MTVVQGEPQYERSTSRKDTEAYLGIAIRLFVCRAFISLGIRLNTSYFSFFVENQYPDEAKREEIANACNSVIQKPGTGVN